MTLVCSEAETAGFLSKGDNPGSATIATSASGAKETSTFLLMALSV
jgi:hypothetical protein